MKKILWLLLLPYLWLACFAMPSADDFSFANKVKNLGLWGAQQDWYQT